MIAAIAVFMSLVALASNADAQGNPVRGAARTVVQAPTSPGNPPKKSDAPMDTARHCRPASPGASGVAGHNGRTEICFQKKPLADADSKVRAAASAQTPVWCDGLGGGVYTTRLSVCTVFEDLVTLVDAKTGEIVGAAELLVAQELGAVINSSVFDESNYITLVAADPTIKGLAVGLTSDCSGPCSPASQTVIPFQVIAVGQTLEGFGEHSWTGTGHTSMPVVWTFDAQSIGSSRGESTWGGQDWVVRCDDELGKQGVTSGCIIPGYIPTFPVDPKWAYARIYIGEAQELMSSHDGWAGHGNPLTRLADDSQAAANRNIVCDSSFTPNSATPAPVQCDEWPFAKSRQSGGIRLPVGHKGNECQQYYAFPASDGTKTVFWWGIPQLPPANAVCARASMPKADNEGVGGDLGRFTTSQRLIDNDPYWVDSGA